MTLEQRINGELNAGAFSNNELKSSGHCGLLKVLINPQYCTQSASFIAASKDIDKQIYKQNSKIPTACCQF